MGESKVVRAQRDDLKAEAMVRRVVGKKVKPRREFSQQVALEVDECDYYVA